MEKNVQKMLINSLSIDIFINGILLNFIKCIVTNFNLLVKQIVILLRTLFLFYHLIPFSKNFHYMISFINRTSMSADVLLLIMIS